MINTEQLSGFAEHKWIRVRARTHEAYNLLDHVRSPRPANVIQNNLAHIIIKHFGYLRKHVRVHLLINVGEAPTICTR